MIAGDRAPDVMLHLSDGSSVPLSTYQGHPVVLYFYPKDDTPGCTREALDFTALMPEFAAVGVSVVGVSRDSARQHVKFARKHALQVPLVSDEDGTVCTAFGTWVEKSMYGKTYLGVERATFLIGADGRIVQIWRKVKVAGHAESVLAATRAVLTA